MLIWAPAAVHDRTHTSTTVADDALCASSRLNAAVLADTSILPGLAVSS